jgi:DnaJ like chaperone protein
MRPIRTLAKLFGRSAEPCGCAPAAACEDSALHHPDYSEAVVALGAKLARADGSERPAEFETLAEVFPTPKQDERALRRFYRLARETTLGFEGYARLLARRYGRCPKLLEDVIDGLFRVAKADGVVSHREIDYLQRVAELLGVAPLKFRALKARHLGAPQDDPYVVLDVAPDASDDQVKRAWKRALLEHHPDRAAGRGLSRADVREAERRSQAINAAYRLVIEERRSGFGDLGAEPA